MLLSRFWYVVLGLVLGASVLLLSMAQSMFNRATERARGEGLSSDSQVISWYLKDDARQRSSQLVKFALDPEISGVLEQASRSEASLKSESRDKVTAALNKVQKSIEPEEAFDAVFAVDQHGRVVGHVGYQAANGMSDFELGGYPVVADALHGFIRDDTLVWNRIYRVVARPVQAEAGAQPAGAIVGARVLDDRFARELSERTGAALAFYVDGSRTASGAPEGFQKSNLDQIVSDLESLRQDPDYMEKGRSGIRTVGDVLSVQYTRLPGEAYALGAGYAVARQSERLRSPFSFFQASDDKDKQAADKLLAVGIGLGAILLGLLFSFLEHTVPLRVFRSEAARLAKGETDQLQPSKFRGIFRKIAAELNEGIDKVAASMGGQSRRAANLEDVLGALPAQPQMAAFAVPGDGPVPATATPLKAPLPGGSAPFAPTGAAAGLPVAPTRAAPVAAPGPGRPNPAAVSAASVAPRTGALQQASADPEEEWRAVYTVFVATKQQCGESTEGFTYEKFRKTLVKNRDALIARHGVSRVKFAVHVKEGKAALKASPVRS